MTNMERIRRRFERLISDAAKAGIVVVADADVQAIRLIERVEYDGAEDLRELGETVLVNAGCGVPAFTTSGSAVGACS